METPPGPSGPSSGSPDVNVPFNPLMPLVLEIERIREELLKATEAQTEKLQFLLEGLRAPAPAPPARACVNAETQTETMPAGTGVSPSPEKRPSILQIRRSSSSDVEGSRSMASSVVHHLVVAEKAQRKTKFMSEPPVADAGEILRPFKVRANPPSPVQQAVSLVLPQGSEAVECRASRVTLRDSPSIIPAPGQEPDSFVEAGLLRSMGRSGGKMGLFKSTKSTRGGGHASRMKKIDQAMQHTLIKRTKSMNELLQSDASHVALQPSRDVDIPNYVSHGEERSPNSNSRLKVSFVGDGSEKQSEVEVDALENLARQPNRRGTTGRAVDHVRQIVHDEIVNRRRNTGMESLELDEVESYESEGSQTAFEMMNEAICGWMDFIATTVLYVSGLVMWDEERPLISRTYQLLVLLLHVAILCFSLFAATNSLDLIHREAKFVTFLSDLVVPFGSVFGIVATLTATDLADCLRDAEESLGEEDSNTTLSNGHDALCTLLLWLAFLADRLGWWATAATTEGQFPIQAAVSLVGFLLASGQLMALTLLVLRVTRHAGGLVDSFCYRFFEEMDYRTAVEEWNVLQASVRIACLAVERVFAVGQVTVVLGAIALALDFSAVGDRDIWSLSSAAILFIMVAQVLPAGAAVTEACTRLPQLINSTSIRSDPMDPERLYLVEYIQVSAAGFYIFNVRLSSDQVLRLCNTTALVAVTVARYV